MKELQEEQRQNKMGMKGMLEKIAEFLQKYVQAPIVGILKFLTRFGGKKDSDVTPYTGGTSATGTASAAMARSRRAVGGPVSPGESYLVGEKGPEVFSPRSGGTISPNSAMGGDTEMNININVSMNERELKAAFDKAHQKTLQLVRRNKQRMMM